MYYETIIHHIDVRGDGSVFGMRCVPETCRTPDFR